MFDRLQFMFGTMKGVRGVHVFAYSIYHDVRPICTSKSRICNVRLRATALNVTCPRCMQTDTYRRLLEEQKLRSKPGRLADLLAACGFKRRNFSSNNYKQKPFRDLRLVFSAEREIRCAFHSIAVSIKAIRAKYKGSVRSFVQRHAALYNRDLAVICVMSSDELNEPILDLKKNGLVGGRDFACFDAFGQVLGFEIAHEKGMNPTKELRFDCTWLKGFVRDGGVMVYHADSK